jgi:3-oxoacyl-[acyl-carrier protein] reductase
LRGGVSGALQFDEPKASFLLTKAGRLRVGNMADSGYTLAPRRSKIACHQTDVTEGNMDLGLKGLRAVVTGGTKGIGRAAADIFAQEGASVAICARNADEVKTAVKDLTAKGVKAYGADINVADKAALQKFITDSAQALGGVDILVANVSALAAQDVEESWSQAFDVDMMHTVNAVNAALPFLEQSKHPSIVVISSVSGREVDFTGPAYGAMKAALIHYAQRLAYQHAPKTIRVNSVSPGNTYFEGGFWQSAETNLPDIFKQALALNPTGRMAKAEEIGRGIVFLASPASSFTTGTNLVIDGALTRGVQF